MTRHAGIVAAILLTIIACCQAQSKGGRKTAPVAPAPAVPATVSTPASPARPGVTVDDVVKMLDAKLSESIIAAAVKKNGTAFDLPPDQLIRLKKAGASDSLISVMMDPSSTYTPSAPAPDRAPAPAAPAATAPAPAAPAATAPAPPAQPAPVSAPTLEVGVYMKKNGQWAEITPEIVNWKTGGALKSLASAGVVKKDLNGNIDGPSSKNSVKTPLEVLIVAPEGIAATEYQFLRLRVNKDYREFRSVTGGILNQRGGAMRDLIPFEAKKIAPRNFLLVVPASIGAGEYGFLPPGAGGSSTTAAVSSSYGKIYTFHLLE